MKNIASKIIPLLKKGHCTPQIARLSRELREPAATIHYNIKKLEKEVPKTLSMYDEIDIP